MKGESELGLLRCILGFSGVLFLFREPRGVLCVVPFRSGILRDGASHRQGMPAAIVRHGQTHATRISVEKTCLA